jgi:hypothetical protein
MTCHEAEHPVLLADLLAVILGVRRYLVLRRNAISAPTPWSATPAQLPDHGRLNHSPSPFTIGHFGA